MHEHAPAIVRGITSVRIQSHRNFGSKRPGMNTHLLESEVPRPVHWLTRTCMGLQEVLLQGEHRVASREVVPLQKPIWYWPAKRAIYRQAWV